MFGTRHAKLSAVPRRAGGNSARENPTLYPQLNGFYKVRIGNGSTALTKGFRLAAVWGVYSKNGERYDYDSFSFVQTYARPPFKLLTEFSYDV